MAIPEINALLRASVLGDEEEFDALLSAAQTNVGELAFMGRTLAIATERLGLREQVARQAEVQAVSDGWIQQP